MEATRNNTFNSGMNSFFGLTKRNCLVYLKDKSTVFFSILAPIIVLGLYLLFLKQNYVSNIENVIKNNGLDVSSDKIDAFVNSWLIAGLLGTSCITVPLSSLSTMVYDKQLGIDKDFITTPVPKGIILLSYLVSSIINTLIIGTLILTIGFVILAIEGATFSFTSVLLGYLYLILGCISGTSAMMFIMCFFKSGASVGAFTGIVCAAVGFLIGAYLPISEFDEWIQILANILPGSHVCGMFRNILMTPTLDNLAGNYTELAQVLKDEFGMTMNFFGSNITILPMVIYTVSITTVIIIVDIFVYNITSKRN